MQSKKGELLRWSHRETAIHPQEGGDMQMYENILKQKDLREKSFSQRGAKKPELHVRPEMGTGRNTGGIQVNRELETEVGLGLS